jgi:uncharacterized membrane protein
MDWYLIVKFLHVACAVAWLGGGLALVILGVLADRARNDAALMAVIGGVVRIAPIVFIPGSVLVLLFGLAMVWLGGWAWEAWLVFGLAGIAVTGAVGTLVLGPLAEKSAKLNAEGRQAEALTAGRRLLKYAKADYVIQFAIVFAMVVKPGWSDLGILLGMAGVVALGLLFALQGKSHGLPA